MKTPDIHPVPDTTGDPKPLEVSETMPGWRTILITVNSVLLLLVLICVSMGGAAIYRQNETIASIQVDLQSLRDHVGSRTVEDIVFLKIMARNPKIEIPLAQEIAYHVIKNARFFKRDADLILAIIDVESRFDPKAVSSAGAVGLMQVMPHWKEKQGITCNLKEIECSIFNGLRIYSFYEAEFNGDIELALTAYNRGPNPIDQAIRAGTNPRNGYAKKIRESYADFQNLTAGISQ